MVTNNKVCENCGTVFRSRHGNQRYCSRSCWVRTPYIEYYTDSFIRRKRASKALQRSGAVPKPCEICYIDHGTIAHHQDYAKPLVVNWLCVSCHRKVHSSVNELRKIVA